MKIRKISGASVFGFASGRNQSSNRQSAILVDICIRKKVPPAPTGRQTSRPHGAQKKGALTVFSLVLYNPTSPKFPLFQFISAKKGGMNHA